jgi:hypothetical protein
MLVVFGKRVPEFHKNILSFFVGVKMEGEEQGVEESVVVWTKNNEQHKVQKLEGKIVFLA